MLILLSAQDFSWGEMRVDIKMMCGPINWDSSIMLGCCNPACSDLVARMNNIINNASVRLIKKLGSDINWIDESLVMSSFI